MRLLLAAAVVLLAIWSGVAGKPAAHERQLLQSGGNRPPLRIGVIHMWKCRQQDQPCKSQDQNLKADARGLINGVYFAIGDSGRKAQVITVSGACNVQTINDTINYLVYDKRVDVIVGPSCSDVVLAAAALINELEVPAITPSGGAVAISQAGPYVWRSNTPASGYLRDLMYAVYSKWDSIVAIYDTTLLSADWTRMAIQYFEEAGGTVLDQLKFNSSKATMEDMTSLAQDALAESPAAVLYMASYIVPDELTATVIKTVRKDIWEYPMILPNGLTADTLSLLVDDYETYSWVKGILTPGDMVYEGWEERYRDAFSLDELGDSNGANYATAYNAASALLTAAKKSGKYAPTPSEINAEMSKATFTFKAWGGAKAWFTPEGDVVAPTQIFQYTDEGLVVPFDPEQP